MDWPGRAPSEVDITRPGVARVYDYYLGGPRHFDSDRQFRRRGAPGVPRAAGDPARQPRLPAPRRAPPRRRGRRPVPRPGLRDPHRGQRARGGPVGGLGLARPVGVLAAQVPHVVADSYRPAELMAAYLSALAPGSHLAISHAGRDGRPEAVDVERVYRRSGSPNATHLRTKPEIAALFGDLEIVEPGLVYPPQWRPGPADGTPEVGDDHPGLAGAGRRP